MSCFYKKEVMFRKFCHRIKQLAFFVIRESKKRRSKNPHYFGSGN